MPVSDFGSFFGLFKDKKRSDRSDDRANIFILQKLEGELIMEQSKKMAKIAYEALDDRKGEDIKIIDISKVSTIADYFVIANGSNSNQVSALVDSVEDKLAKEGFYAKQREGIGLGSWVLLDFGEIIVHVFDKENRLFYDLERVWRDGVSVDVDTL